MSEYLVLIPCRSDATSASFEYGDIVTTDDFPADVIDNWLEIVPPVLEPLASPAEEEE